MFVIRYLDPRSWSGMTGLTATKVMSIYTKTGDTGKTSLLSGERVFKDCINLRVVGELDELNSSLGVILSVIPTGVEESFLGFIQTIQKNLFKLGGELASLQNSMGTVKGTENSTDRKIEIDDIEKLEKEIDLMEKELPELKNFILPGGSQAGAELHRARTVCRRAERELVAFSKEQKVRPEVHQYLNRLSDYLFVTARWVNFKLKEEEIKIFF